MSSFSEFFGSIYLNYCCDKSLTSFWNQRGCQFLDNIKLQNISDVELENKLFRKCFQLLDYVSFNEDEGIFILKQFFLHYILLFIHENEKFETTKQTTYIHDQILELKIKQSHESSEIDASEYIDEITLLLNQRKNEVFTTMKYNVLNFTLDMKKLQKELNIHEHLGHHSFHELKSLLNDLFHLDNANVTYSTNSEEDWFVALDSNATNDMTLTICVTI